MCIKSRLATSFLLFTGALPLYSQAEMGSIKLDNGIDLTPVLTLDYVNNDNVLYAETNEVDAWLSQISTGLLAELKHGRSEFSLDYKGQWGSYSSSSTDNFSDHRIQFDFLTVPAEQSDLYASLYYSKQHENRGQGLSQGFGADLLEPVEYDDIGGEIGWKFSLLAERVWLDTKLGFQNKEYQNLPQYTKNKDRDNVSVQLGLFWQTGTGSQVFLRGQHTRIDYDDQALGELSRDGDDYRTMAGIRWQRGELGAGNIGIGYQHKTFDSSLRNDFNGLSWDIGLEWSPLERLQFNLDSRRASVEPPLDGDYIRQMVHQFAVDYEFMETMMITANYRYLDETYIGIERNESTSAYGIEIGYDFRSNIRFTFIAQREDKESSLAEYAYQQNLLGLQVSFGVK